MRLGIIIPMLNEATGLADLCEHLVPFARAGVEIVFVDGGAAMDRKTSCVRPDFTCWRARRAVLAR